MKEKSVFTRRRPAHVPALVTGSEAKAHVLQVLRHVVPPMPIP